MTTEKHVHSVRRQHLEAVEAVCVKFEGYVESIEERMGPPGLSPTTTILIKDGLSVSVTTAMEQTKYGYRFVTTTQYPTGG